MVLSGPDDANEAAGPDRGSVLVLLPACTLVVVVLASIAVDMSLVHLRQRQAFDVAASAANDAVTAGADTELLRSGTYRLDPTAGNSVVGHRVASSDLAPHLAEAPHVTITDDTVEVTLAVEVDYLFSGIMPGAPKGTVVTATASATAHEL